MRNLSSIPAFGFESSQMNANQAYIEYETFIYEKNLKNSGNFQLVNCDQMVVDYRAKIENTVYWKKSNITKGLAYLPIVGLIIGIQRLILAHQNPLLTNKIKHIVRGTLESIGLGLLLLIPDLIATAARAQHRPRTYVIR